MRSHSLLGGYVVDGAQRLTMSEEMVSEVAVAGAILRMLREWHRLDVSARLDLLDDINRMGHYYVGREGELPTWLQTLIWEVALRQRQLEYEGAGGGR